LARGSKIGFRFHGHSRVNAGRRQGTSHREGTGLNDKTRGTTFGLPTNGRWGDEKRESTVGDHDKRPSETR
jgi:hypothetical protein